ncbi:MAG: diguanylate cyclase domain-containing protein [Anaerovoracaceae bacterium]
MKKIKEWAAGRIYVLSITIYMIVSIVLLSVFMFSSSLMTIHYNQEQIRQVSDLYTSRVNRSIQSMNNLVVQSAGLFSSWKDLSFEEAYKMLVSNGIRMRYSSCGLTDMDGNLYCSTAIKADFEEVPDLWEAAYLDQGTIVAPYRSHLSGVHVMTFFQPIYADGKHAGSVFFSYDLSTVLQLLAEDASVDNNEVFLMEGSSGNFIACSDREGQKTATWKNLRMISGNLQFEGNYDLKAWMDDLQKGVSEGCFRYQTEGIHYLQAFRKIDSLPGWYVSVRIPDNSVSELQVRIKLVGVICLLSYVFLTVILIIILQGFERKRRMEAQLLSEEDPVTGGLNRRAMQLQLQQYAENLAVDEMYAMAFFDLDYFKEVNDRFGHDAGDEVLRSFYQCLTRCFPDESTIVARVGGDEFMLVVKDVIGRGVVNRYMDKLQEAVRGISVPDCPELRVTFSCGIAMYPEHGQNPDTLRKNADKALYHRKKHGRDGYTWYIMEE